MRFGRSAMIVAVISAMLLSVAVGSPFAGASPFRAAHWGSFFGNGNAHNDTLLLPTSIQLPGPVVEVATSNSTQYALLADGSVYAWGLGGDGQLGNGTTADSFTVPMRVQFPAGVTIASLPTDSMPYNTGLAIDTTGHAWGWGLDQYGQLCEGCRRVSDPDRGSADRRDGPRGCGRSRPL
jgi:alpha-tubulin suppressor-like RCC1 family protein